MEGGLGEEVSEQGKRESERVAHLATRDELHELQLFEGVNLDLRDGLTGGADDLWRGKSTTENQSEEARNSATQIRTISSMSLARVYSPKRVMMMPPR